MNSHPSSRPDGISLQIWSSYEIPCPIQACPKTIHSAHKAPSRAAAALSNAQGVSPAQTTLLIVMSSPAHCHGQSVAQSRRYELPGRFSERSLPSSVLICTLFPFSLSLPPSHPFPLSSPSPLPPSLCLSPHLILRNFRHSCSVCDVWYHTMCDVLM